MALYHITNDSSEYQTISNQNSPNEDVTLDPGESGFVTPAMWDALSPLQQGNFTLVEVVDNDGASAADMQTLINAVNDVKTAVDNVDISVDSVNLNADAINLSTDTLETKVQATNDKLDGEFAVLQSLDSKDYATETTLAGNGAKADTTNSKLDILNTTESSALSELVGIHTDTQSLDGKDFATESTLSLLESKDFATENTLNLINGKDFSTSAKQDAAKTVLDAIKADLDTLNGLVSTAAKQDLAKAVLDGISTSVDGVEALLTSLDGKDYATQTTLAAVLAALGTIDGHVDGLEGFTDGLEGALATLNGKDFATQTTLASVLSSLNTLVAAAATETTLALVESDLGTLLTTVATETTLAALQPALLAALADLLSAGADNAVTSEVPADTSDTELLPANPNRKGATFYNDSGAILYIKLGVGASNASFMRPIAPTGFYELLTPTYRGAIHGAWSAVDGEVRITEMS